MTTLRMSQLCDIFDRFDMDSDRSLTVRELAGLLRSLGLSASGNEIHDLLTNMDSNGNGFVEFEELVEAISNQIDEQTLVNQEQLLEIFQLFDRDGNGVITKAELAGGLAKMGQPLTWRELTEMMIQADTNGDGVISFTEFSTVMARSTLESLGIVTPV